MRNILITGGAGFIGSHLADKLVNNDYHVRIFDNLSEQIHGAGADWPEHLKRDNIELVRGDICDRETLGHALKGVNVVVHLASETGVGQSMYEIEKYVYANIQGTAILLDLLAQHKGQVEKIVLSSSRAIYGEGKYECSECGVMFPPPREPEQLSRASWELDCPNCARELKCIPTSEDSLPSPASIYAVTKLSQEQLLASFGKSHNVPYSILRYQNVYGPRQSLNNPYTGILSIFSSRILNGNQIQIFEDGKESRDFVFIDDVVQATILAIENKTTAETIFNVGTGEPTSVMKIATILCEKLGAKQTPVVIEQSRVGDIRHCYANLDAINRALGYEPQYDIEKGLARFVEWVVGEELPVDKSDKALDELKKKNLFV